MQPIKTAIVVIHYGPPDKVFGCLDSLAAARVPAESIYVVDNPCAKSDSEAIAHAYSQLTVITPIENLGFAGGANAGVERAFEGDYTYALILNNDLTVDAQTVHALEEYLDADNSIGIAGAIPCFKQSGHPHFTSATINWDRGKPKIRTDESRLSESIPYDTEFATGCAICLRRTAIEEAGPFDDRYFLYWEDVDLCFRVRAHGYRTVIAPEARVLHELSAATGKSSPLTIYYQTRNRLLFFRSHASNPIRRSWLLTRLTLSRGFRGLGKSLSGNRREGNAYVMGVLDFYRGRFGRRDELH